MENGGAGMLIVLLVEIGIDKSGERGMVSFWNDHLIGHHFECRKLNQFFVSSPFALHFGTGDVHFRHIAMHIQ